MKLRKITKDVEDHEVECPHCGETQIVNAGTGNYGCTDCGGDIEIILACLKCGEELDVEEWGETECPYRCCGASFDSWKEAELTPAEDAADEDPEDHEVECPHCVETQIVNAGTGNYGCTNCGGDIEITLACLKCGEELEVEEWGETECPYRGCGASFDSWKEAELTPAEDAADEDPEDHEVEPEVTPSDDAAEEEDPRTKPGLIKRMLNFLGIERPNSALNKVIGKYRFVKILGEGAFGQTWEAVDLITYETVALKLYKNATSSGKLRELQKEVQNMRGIQHPHLVAYTDSNIIGSDYYLATEFCSRGSLANIGRLPAATAIRYINQILDGIGYLHARGILHRDIKPDNIFLDQDGQIKVGDFGISIDAEHTIIGEYAGTPFYMAPEQFSGRTSRRSDIWSIGVVAYELLHGTRPFASLEEIVQGHKPRIAIRGRGLAAILTKALDRNEKRRFQTCAEFKNALELN